LVYRPLCGCGFRNIGGIIFSQSEDFILNTLFACVAVVDNDTVDSVADFFLDSACVLCQMVAPFLDSVFFCGACFRLAEKTLLNKKLPLLMFDKHWGNRREKGHSENTKTKNRVSKNSLPVSVLWINCKSIRHL